MVSIFSSCFWLQRLHEESSAAWTLASPSLLFNVLPAELLTLALWTHGTHKFHLFVPVSGLKEQDQIRVTSLDGGLTSSSAILFLWNPVLSEEGYSSWASMVTCFIRGCVKRTIKTRVLVRMATFQKPIFSLPWWFSVVLRVVKVIERISNFGQQ